MQSTNELQRLRTLITRSPLLTQIEKAEWLQLLSEMTEAQSTELSAILIASEEALQKQGAQRPGAQMSSLSQAPQLSKISQPSQIAQPSQPAQFSKPIQFSQPEQHQPAVAEPVLTIHTAQTALQGQNLPSNLPPHLASSSPHLAPAPQKTSQEHSSAKEPNHLVAEPTMHINSPDDLSKLPVDYLRQGQTDPQLILDNLLRTIADLTRHYKFTMFIGKIEASPLYKEYNRLGMALLNDTQGDREAIYQNYQRTAAQHDQPYLTKEEFEAFTDFRKAEERMLS
jgi:hypothetical protein